MEQGSWTIRRATADDAEFLADMLLAAVNWSPLWKPRTRRRVLTDPRTAHYVAGWPRPGDLGVIAEVGRQDRRARPGSGSSRPAIRATASPPRTCPS